MGWSGGIFTRVHDWTEDEAGGYDILSTRMDEEDDNFEAGINACLTKDGTNLPTANLPMGDKRHTGVGNGQARNDYSAVGQVQDGSFIWGGTTGGSLNAYTIVVAPAFSNYKGGQTFSFIADRTNSGQSTLNVGGLGAKNIYANGAPLTSGMIVTNCVYTVVYDGTRFHIISGVASGTGGASFGGALIFMNSSQELVPGDALAIIDFRGEAYDDSSYHASSTNYLQIPVTGRYRITASALIKHAGLPSTPPGSSVLEAVLTCNGITMNSSYCNATISDTWGDTSLIIPSLQVVWEGILTVADQIRLKVAQNNENGLYLVAYGNGLVADSCYMAIERIK